MGDPKPEVLEGRLVDSVYWANSALWHIPLRRQPAIL